MESGFFRKKVIERYFLEREAPYSKRKRLNTKAIYVSFAVCLVLFLGSVIFFGGKAEKKEAEAAKLDYSKPLPVNQTVAGGLQATPDTSSASAYSSTNRGSSISGASGSTGNRLRNAAQVVRRGDGGGDPGARLPMGYGISARLLNAILSSDSATPVIAEITQDVFPPGDSGSTLSIPTGTKAIGNATYDDTSQRIQVRFHTLVYPEGDQHSIQGVGLMGDGSAGLAGDYHSGETKRQIGGFIGNFVGGLAEGMKERTSQGVMGMPYEPGSIKNGLLNGVSQSASDISKSYSDDLRQTRPTMSLPAGQSFILFLEHEYTP